MQHDIKLSAAAVTAAIRLRDSESKYREQSLRIYLDGKGCDGFFYGVAFDARDPDDLEVAMEGLSVIVDKASYQFLAGSTVDFVDDERGKGFLVDNPGHKKFRGKFFKKREWVEKLTGQAP